MTEDLKSGKAAVRETSACGLRLSIWGGQSAPAPTWTRYAGLHREAVTVGERDGKVGLSILSGKEKEKEKDWWYVASVGHPYPRPRWGQA